MIFSQSRVTMAMQECILMLRVGAQKSIQTFLKSPKIAQYSRIVFFVQNVFSKLILGYFKSPKIARNSGIVSFSNFKIFMGRYTLYHSFSCPKFQLPIKSPEVPIFEKQCLTMIMKGMRWQKLQVYIKYRRQRALQGNVQESCILQSSQFLPTHSFHNLRLTLLFKYSDVW